jgi:hypothetical protein
MRFIITFQDTVPFDQESFPLAEAAAQTFAKK